MTNNNNFETSSSMKGALPSLPLRSTNALTVVHEAVRSCTGMQSERCVPITNKLTENVTMVTCLWFSSVREGQCN
jgi:hypothetical protein